MDIELQQAWFPAETAPPPLPQRLSSRVAIPLIGITSASLWAGIFMCWHLVF